MRLLTRLALTALLFAVIASPAYAGGSPFITDTTTLAEADPDLDGLTVQFRGEAVGEALRADAEHRWLSVLDEGTAIGVYSTVAQVDAVDGFGDWRMTGSVVEVTGVYNIACDQHGGDLDVHAIDVVTLSAAVARDNAVDPAKAVVAGVALAISLALALRLRSSRRRTE